MTAPAAPRRVALSALRLALLGGCLALLGGCLALLGGCLSELTVAPCYSAADCPTGSTCVAAACTPAPDAGGGGSTTCTVEPATRVRTVGFPYTGDRVPPAALGFDGTRYWAVVEDVVPGPDPIFELYTVRLDREGQREMAQENDPVVRGRSTGEPVGPFLVRRPSGLVAGWNERASSAVPYVGYAGALGPDGVVAAPQAFAGQVEELVLDGDAVFAPLTLGAEGSRAALQALASATVTRFDVALFAPSAVRVPGGEWLVVAERGDDVQLIRLSSAFVERDTFVLVDGARGAAQAPRALWTGDALVVVYTQTTTAGTVVQHLETDALGEVTQQPRALTATITGLPSTAYAPARDELAVVYNRGGRVELLRLSRQTDARTIHPLSSPALAAEEPSVIDSGAGEYAAAWLEADAISGNVLKMSRVVCR